MHGCKQRAVIFEVFILWLRNQHQFSHDIIRIKMIPRDLPYNESRRTKTHHGNKLQLVSMPLLYIEVYQYGFLACTDIRY